MLITPGFPDQWSQAVLTTPEISFDFRRSIKVDKYKIALHLPKKLKIELRVTMLYDDIESILVNGKTAGYQVMEASVGKPVISIHLPLANSYDVVIRWRGNSIKQDHVTKAVESNGTNDFKFAGKTVLEYYDPQSILTGATNSGDVLKANVIASAGEHVFFARLKQGSVSYWQPVHVRIPENKKRIAEVVESRKTSYRQVDLSKHFNDKVTNIFKHEYLSPRPTSPTLQLPTQGIGNWAYPLTMADINDSGLRAKAKENNNTISYQSIVFATPSDTLSKNVLFTSQWDYFPSSYSLPLTGKVNVMHVLVAGTTNPMQSRITNGRLIVSYSDKTSDTLDLVNPENWWPIEQDYFIDGFAFNAGKQRPVRLHLKTGEFTDRATKYESIKGFSNFAVPGGSATVLRMKINPGKELQSLTVEAVANDVIVGLIAVTLETNE